MWYHYPIKIKGTAKMLKTTFKRILAVILLLCTLFSLSACMTPSKKLYTSKEKNAKADKVTRLLRDAEAKTDGVKDIKITYSFFVECEVAKDTVYKLGTENIISVKGKNTDGMTAHRKNTFTSLKNASVTQSESEDFYYSDKTIYTKRFGKYLYSEMSGEDFIPYTEYSDISVNTDFLSEIFFNKATVYNRLGGETEIAFEKPEDYLKDGIISFIGLDQTDYIYEVNDVILTAIIDKNGYMAEKHLTFTVDYHTEESPDNVLTYEGDFSYTADRKSDFKVEAYNKANSYRHFSNIKLLSSITEQGYAKLFESTAISATYSKVIKATDNKGNEFNYSALLDLRSALRGDTHYFSSIDTENMLKDYEAKEDIKSHDTVGVFITESGYSERSYDYITDSAGQSVDNREHDYTTAELYTLMMQTLGAEQLFEDEISSVSVQSETDTEIVYSVVLNNMATKYFAGYLFEVFSDSSDGAVDVDQLGFTPTKCDIFITVRKSDGCLLKQIIDYEAELFSITDAIGTISVSGKCELTVNSTEDNFEMLGITDYENTVNSNKSQ